MYWALVDRIDWSLPDPWRSLLQELNPSQRAVVSVVQVHQHAQVNGLENAVAFHGTGVVSIAAGGAEVLGRPDVHALLDAALADPTEQEWEALERAWDSVGVEIEEFIESHSDDFFLD